MYKGIVGGLLASFILVGCGGGSSESPENNNGLPGEGLNPSANLPDESATSGLTQSKIQKNISSIAIFGADGVAITPSSVDVISGNASQSVGASISSVKNVSLSEELVPGQVYKLKVIMGDGKVFFVQYKVDSANASESGKTIVPAIVNAAGETVKLDGIIGLITGSIFDYKEGGLFGGAVSGAEVRLSAGQATNGAYASTTTDENGNFALFVNVSKTKMSALLQSELSVTKEGFFDYKLSGLQVTKGLNLAGLNVLLLAESSSDLLTEASQGDNVSVLAQGAVLFSETFEQTSITVNDWKVNSNTNGGDTTNTWHVHTSGLNIFNAQCSGYATQLAPNDTSNCALPNPAEGSAAYWYGNPSSDTPQLVGNFMGGLESSNNMIDYTNSGELISPWIDLTNHTGDVALTFKTWWEIESVNPNASGYDLMQISYKKENSTDWTPVSKLNPLTDPAFSGEKEFIPFSNTGFNSAPTWLNQEPLQFSDVAGSRFKIKFTFSTEDGLFNSFRGWMIDDVKLLAQVGTFPVVDSSGEFYTGEELYSSPNGFAYIETDAETFLPIVTPSPVSGSFDSIALEEGTQQDFTAKINVNGLVGNSISFIFKGYNQVPLGTNFGKSSIVEDDYILTLTGSTAIPSATEEGVELWIEVKDSEGSIVFTTPIMYYFTEEAK